MDDALLGEAKAARDQLGRLEAESERRRLEFHQAIRRLHSAGPSMRDIASALGLSHQRVHQIVNGGKDMAAPTRRSNILNRLVRRRREDCEPNPGSIRRGDLVDSRFHVDAREAISLAQQEARALNHGYLGTEHLLLGLMRTEQSFAGRLLRAAGVDLERSRSMIENLLGTPPAPPDDQLTPTARVKQVLELASVEAKLVHATHVRSEHLLLGLAREGRGLGARVLAEFGIGYEQIRARISRAAHDCSYCGRSGLHVAHLVTGPGVHICDHCVDAAGTLPGPAQAQLQASPLNEVSKVTVGAACSFCGRGVAAVDRLVRGAVSDTAICGECLVLCRQIQSDERGSFRPGLGYN